MVHVLTTKEYKTIEAKAGNNKQTLKDAGFKYFKKSCNGGHILINEDSGYELWCANKYGACYGLIYKNTHLEFCCTVKPDDQILK
jgi:hypothetical protein